MSLKADEQNLNIYKFIVIGHKIWLYSHKRHQEVSRSKKKEIKLVLF